MRSGAVVLTIAPLMNRTTSRLRLALVMLAWLAQALLPVAHAVAMAGAKAGAQAWCGEPASAMAALAVMPPEIRAALDEGGVSADHLGTCSLLCAAGTGAPPMVDVAPTVALRAAGLEPAPTPLSRPLARPQAPPPPAHAPPARG